MHVTADDLLAVAATPGEITREGLRNNVSVGIRYLHAWLEGAGAVAIDNLMEDAATAEISRSQIWQWLHHGKVTLEEVQRVIAEEADHLGPGFDDARALFDEVATRHAYVEFLTVPAYDRLLLRESL